MLWTAVRATRLTPAASSVVTVPGALHTRSQGVTKYSAKAPGRSFTLQAPWRKPATRSPREMLAGGTFAPNASTLPAKSLPTIQSELASGCAT